MREPFRSFSPSLPGDEERAEVMDTLHSAWITTGSKVLAFEEKLQAYLGAPSAVALDARTAGRHVGLPAFQRRRREIVKAFHQALGDLDWLKLPGERPEVERSWHLFVLDDRPGITDPAPDPEAHCVQVILPDKLRLGLDYARRATPCSDPGGLLRTLGLGGIRRSR